MDRRRRLRSIHYDQHEKSTKVEKPPKASSSSSSSSSQSSTSSTSSPSEKRNKQHSRSESRNLSPANEPIAKTKCVGHSIADHRPTSNFERPKTRHYIRTKPNRPTDNDVDKTNPLKLLSDTNEGSSHSNQIFTAYHQALNTTPTSSSPSVKHDETKCKASVESAYFYIRRKRLRSELNEDGLWDGLPVVLRYPKNIQKTKMMSVNLRPGDDVGDTVQSKSKNNCECPSDNVKPVKFKSVEDNTSTSSKIKHCGRRFSESEDSRGFSFICSDTQPFTARDDIATEDGDVKSNYFNLIKEDQNANVAPIPHAPATESFCNPADSCEVSQIPYEDNDVDNVKVIDVSCVSLGSYGCISTDASSNESIEKLTITEQNISTDIVGTPNITPVDKSSSSESSSEAPTVSSKCGGNDLNVGKDRVQALTRSEDDGHKNSLSRKQLVTDLFGSCSSTTKSSAMGSESGFSVQEMYLNTDMSPDNDTTSSHKEVRNVREPLSVDMPSLLKVNTKRNFPVGNGHELINTENNHTLEKGFEQSPGEKITRESREVSNQTYRSSPSSCQTCIMDCHCRIIETSTDTSIDCEHNISGTLSDKENPKSSKILQAEAGGSDRDSSKTAMTESGQSHFTYSGDEKTADSPLLSNLSSIQEPVSCETQNSIFSKCSAQMELFSSCSDISNTCSRNQPLNSDSCSFEHSQEQLTNLSVSHGRTMDGCSTQSCLPESHYSNDRLSRSVTMFSSFADVSSDYPNNTADTTQFGSNVCQIQKVAIPIFSPEALSSENSVVEARSKSSTESQEMLDGRRVNSVNYLGKKADVDREQLLKVGFLPSTSIESTTTSSVDTDNSSKIGKLHIDLSRETSPQTPKSCKSKTSQSVNSITTPKRSIRLQRKAFNLYRDPPSTSSSTSSTNKMDDCKLKSIDEIKKEKLEIEEIPDESNCGPTDTFKELERTKREIPDIKELLRLNTGLSNIIKPKKKRKLLEPESHKSRNTICYPETSSILKKEKRGFGINKLRTKIKLKKIPKCKLKKISAGNTCTTEASTSEGTSSSSNSTVNIQKLNSSQQGRISSDGGDSQLDAKSNKKKTGRKKTPSSSRTTRTSKYGRRCEEAESSEVFMPSETLVDHAKTLWMSENRWAFQQIHKSDSPNELNSALELEWNLVSPKTKVRFYTRARYALLDEDKHSVRRKKKKVKEEKLNKEEEEQIELFRRNTSWRCVSDIDRFLKLKPIRQREHLKKWLMFYQKLLSRNDYSQFLYDFEQMLSKNRVNGPDDSNRPTGSDMDFFHRKVLFECLKKFKPNVINNCSKKFHQKITELKTGYSDLIWKLIEEEEVEFVTGCRSERLDRTLKDLMEAENGGKIDVLGRPRQTESYTSILGDLETSSQAIQPEANLHLFADLPEIINIDLEHSILNDISTLNELPVLNLSDYDDFGFDFQDQCTPFPNSTGDGFSVVADNMDAQTLDYVETNIRAILHQEANEAFVRSIDSFSKSCCELDSPSCILSIWEAADSASRPTDSRTMSHTGVFPK